MFTYKYMRVVNEQGLSWIIENNDIFFNAKTIIWFTLY